MKYLAVEDILVIHAKIIEETGGAHGVRDVGLLASAASRPRMEFGGKELYTGIFAKAAVYTDSLAKHHVFVDGNKRTAFATTVRFLFQNGMEFKGANRQVEKFMVKVIVDRLDIPAIAQWLEKHSRPIKK